MKEAAKKQEEAAAMKKREEEEKEEVEADEMKQEVEPKNEPKAVQLSNEDEDDPPPEANCFRQKRSAQEMGAIDESIKPKRNKRALLTGENFIKFNSNDDEENTFY